MPKIDGKEETIQKQKEQKQKEAQLSMPLQTDTDLDVAASLLNPIPFEALVVLLVNGQLPTGTIETHIQFAYIFDFLAGQPGAVQNYLRYGEEGELKEKNKSAIGKLIDKMDDSYKYMHDYNWTDTRTLLKRYDPKLRELLKAYSSDSEPKFRELLLLDQKKPRKTAHQKRQKIITLINKNTNYRVPSYPTIKKSLEEIERLGYIKKGWTPQQVFLEMWNKRRGQIIEEWEQKKQSLRSGLTKTHKNEDAYTTEEAIASNAARYIEERYSPRILDFYRIKLGGYLTADRREHASKYLKYIYQIKKYLS